MRYKDGCTLETRAERERVAQCLIAATERRISHVCFCLCFLVSEISFEKELYVCICVCMQGVRLDISTKNRIGLLSDVTRIFRENGLSITRADIGTCGDKAVGTFYVKDVSGQSVSDKTLETIKEEIDGTVVVVNKSLHWSPLPIPSNSAAGMDEGRSKFSLGTLFWSQLERLSSSFRPIKS